MLPGAALAGRDIRSYYRNFLVNPNDWWKTYSFALGGLWFNPYLPFGASSCTSIAQRQSDAIRAVAKVFGVLSKTVAILDDFLLVLPRRRGESDEKLLERATVDAEKFDELLKNLNLPKAKEKDQPPNFSTIWFGFLYDSKASTLGIPEKKWNKLREFFTEVFVQKDGISLKTEVKAKLLEKALGKFHHVTTVWSPGRPPLYSLWCVYFTADCVLTQNKNTSKCIWSPCPNQMLYLGKKAQQSLQFWLNRLKDKDPPKRLMLKCTHRPRSALLDIFRVPLKGGGASLFLSMQTMMAEYKEDVMRGADTGAAKSYETVWLELLLEGLLVLDIQTGVQVIYVRTNIWKLANILEKQLYVKDLVASEISAAIHAQLWNLALQAVPQGVPQTTMELRCALLPAPFQ